MKANCSDAYTPQEHLGLSPLTKSLQFLFFRTVDDDSTPPDCFEKDTVAVNTEEIFSNNCEDIHGNKYEENSETSSCCGCLM